jgi:hypothetical protein
MLAPFAILFFPGSSLVAAVAAFGLFSFRRKAWYFLLWLPIVLWSLVGTVGFVSAIGYLQEISHEPNDAATGFAGLGAMFVLGRTVFFVVALVLCCIGYPRRDSLRPKFIGFSILFSATIFIAIYWQMRSRVPVTVVDSDGHSIANIEIHFDSGEGIPGFRTRGSVKTDSDGKAVIHDYSHPRLAVSVVTRDYYVPNDERYVMVDSHNVERERTGPVVFHLRKKGEAARIIHGLKLFGSRIDGTQSYLDLSTARAALTPPGDLTVQCTRSGQNAEKKFDWTFSLGVVGGGIIESTNEFMFLAPDSGYKPSFQISHRINEPDWTWQEKRRFFVRSQDGKHYARIMITIMPGYGQNAAYDLEWYLNSDGSPNLESDPSRTTEVR